MGNKTGKDYAADSCPVQPYYEKWEELYESLCCDHVLSAPLFETHFRSPDEEVTKNLFNQFFVDLVNPAIETKGMFIDRCNHITSHISDITSTAHIHFFFDLICNVAAEINYTDLKKIVHSYHVFGVNQILLDSKDDTSTCVQFDHNDNVVTSIVNSMLNGRNSIGRKEVVEWIHCNCPKMSNGLRTWLEYRFLGNVPTTVTGFIPQPSECSSSNLLLTSTCLWYLCCVLPSCYTYMENKFKIDEDEELDVSDAQFTWNLLYNSNQHGLSLNRFKHKVLDYKSPTVTLIELSCGLIIALALDEKWIDSPEKYGGTYCQLIELSPTVCIVEAGSKMVYLKECGRSVPTGLLIGSDTKPKIKLSTDLNTAEICYKDQSDEQVERMEVWGCGGVQALQCQRDMKKWEQKETEKRKKVKLPGQWDADKTILEMGGVCVDHSQRGDIR